MAELIPLRGGEALEHQVLRSTQLWKVTIRWRADLLADCRLLLHGEPINIIGTPADPDRKRETLVMTCESGVRT